MGEKKIRARQAPTMADVARLAGVNRVTASVALRGVQAGTHVSEATRQRILDAARQLGYTPNAIAMALRRKRTDIIGYYIGHGYLEPHDPFTADVIAGLQSGCGTYQQDLLMFGGFQRRSDDEIYAALSSGKIDGLVLLPSPHNPVMDKLVSSHLAVVAIANKVESLPSVLVDDVAGGQAVARYLAEQGHRYVLYRGDRFSLTSQVQRQQAFVRRATEYGIQVAIIITDDWHGHVSDEERELLTAPPEQRPTAAVNWVDTFAYSLLADCEQLGIRVPDDLAIVGFDGVKTNIPPARSLTTVRAPWREVAETAVDTLMALIEGKEVDAEKVFPVELVIGDTT